jgi:FkbM family methyltransferase
MPKFHKGWWFPDHEAHLIDWMNSKKNKIVMNDRPAYQGQKQLAALKHCRQFRMAVDVGAHVGTWAWNLSYAFNRVVGFEPVAAHRECFEKNTEGTRNVELMPYALGAESSSVSMSTEQGSSGNTTVAGGGPIEMRTLDSFGFIHVDFIKVDVEGFEENVLRGGEQTIRACKPVIVVEQKRTMASRFGLPTMGAVRLLELWGYKVIEEISGDFVMAPR